MDPDLYIRDGEKYLRERESVDGKFVPGPVTLTHYTLVIETNELVTHSYEYPEGFLIDEVVSGQVWELSKREGEEYAGWTLARPKA